MGVRSRRGATLGTDFERVPEVQKEMGEQGYTHSVEINDFLKTVFSDLRLVQN